jgi:hypothetical protein
MQVKIDGDALLPHEFYVTKNRSKEDLIALGLSTDSSVQVSERTPLEWGQDPALPTLMLPLQSWNEFRRFVSDGIIEFQKLGKVREKSAASLELQARTNQMISDLLDKWYEAEQKLAQERRDREKAPLYQMMLQLRADLASGKEQNGPVALSVLVISASFVGLVSGPMEAASQALKFVPISDGLASIKDIVHTQLHSGLGIAAGLLGVMTAYQFALADPTLQQMTSMGIGKKRGNADAEMAKRFALTVVSQCGSASFQAFLMERVIAGVKGASKLNEEGKTMLSVMTRVVLLMAALAAVYKQETGGLTDIEMKAYLDGSMKADPKDIRTVVLAMLQAHLALLPDSVADKLRDAVLAYLDSDPDVKELTDPAKVFEGIFETGAYSPIDSQAA